MRLILEVLRLSSVRPVDIYQENFTKIVLYNKLFLTLYIWKYWYNSQDQWVSTWKWIILYDVECSAIITWLIFYKFITKTPHSSPARARYWVLFVNEISDVYSASFTEVMFAISCHIGPCYNDTQLHLILFLLSPNIYYYWFPSELISDTSRAYPVSLACPEWLQV